MKKIIKRTIAFALASILALLLLAGCGKKLPVTPAGATTVASGASTTISEDAPTTTASPVYVTDPLSGGTVTGVDGEPVTVPTTIDTTAIPPSSGIGVTGATGAGAITTTAKGVTTTKGKVGVTTTVRPGTTTTKKSNTATTTAVAPTKDVWKTYWEHAYKNPYDTDVGVTDWTKYRAWNTEIDASKAGIYAEIKAYVQGKGATWIDSWGTAKCYTGIEDSQKGGAYNASWKANTFKLIDETIARGSTKVHVNIANLVIGDKHDKIYVYGDVKKGADPFMYPYNVAAMSSDLKQYAVSQGFEWREEFSTTHGSWIANSPTGTWTTNPSFVDGDGEMGLKAHLYLEIRSHKQLGTIIKIHFEPLPNGELNWYVVYG